MFFPTPERADFTFFTGLPGLRDCPVVEEPAVLVLPWVATPSLAAVESVDTAVPVDTVDVGDAGAAVTAVGAERALAMASALLRMRLSTGPPTAMEPVLPLN